LPDPYSSNNSIRTGVQIVSPNSAPQTGLTSVGAGGNQSFAIRSDGFGLAWGANSFGQLGTGSTTDKSLPIRIEGVNSLTKIDGGTAHTLALRTGGSVWTWGRNDFGQLGDGTTVDRFLPTQVAGVSNITSFSAGGR